MFSPFAKLTSNSQCLIQNEKKFFIDTSPFFCVKGKTQHVLKLYCITWETPYLSFLSHLSKTYSMQSSFTATDFIISFIGFSYSIKKDILLSGLNSRIFFVSHTLSDKMFVHSINFLESSHMITLRDHCALDNLTAFSKSFREDQSEETVYLLENGVFFRELLRTSSLTDRPYLMVTYLTIAHGHG